METQPETKLTLSELRELKRANIEIAKIEEIPNRIATFVLTCGEGYMGRFDYCIIMPIYYDDKVVVLSAIERVGTYSLTKIEFERTISLLGCVTNRFIPTELDEYTNLPKIGRGDMVLAWKLSSFGSIEHPDNIFVPGNWWEAVQRYLPSIEIERKEAGKAAQEAEREKLIKQLLVGKSV